LLLNARFSSKTENWDFLDILHKENYFKKVVKDVINLLKNDLLSGRIYYKYTFLRRGHNGF